MKYRLAILALAIAQWVSAAPVVVITNYYPSYILVQGTNDNVGTTGLSTGVVYACFNVADLSGVTSANANGTNATSDVRPLLYGIVDKGYLSYTALDDTNKPAQMVIGRGESATSSTNIIVQHLLKTTRTITDSTVTGE